MKSSVSIVSCEKYDEERVMIALRESIHLIGGIQAYIRKGNRVLLKPNVLYGKSPEKAVTTHPAILKGMVRIVREAGGIPSIGDSPAVGSLRRAAEKSGIKAVADEMNCPLVEFNRPVVPRGAGSKMFKKLEIDEAVLEADVVVNLPKWKTHAQMLLTLGVKNLFGCIPGPRKAQCHLMAGEDAKAFARILVDVYRSVQPSLTVLDGIVGMQGNGPNSGRPISIGLVLASGDALNLDQVVCDLVGISRKSLLTNRVAFDQGIAREEIDVLGKKVEEVKISDFQFPSISRTDWGLPGFLSSALKEALTSKPAVVEEMCESCDECTKICPPNALTRKGKDLVFDYKQCIRCFCCLEVCPSGAISIEPGWALKIAGRKR